MKILAVSHNALLLRELTSELSHIYPGAEISDNTDPLMAGKYSFSHDVDVVFAEADMKRMNGLQLIQYVRHEHPDVKSYLIGTEKELSDSFLIVSEDVTGILTYPFTKDSMRKALGGKTANEL